jgi:hypothetical protein
MAGEVKVTATVSIADLLGAIFTSGSPKEAEPSEVTPPNPAPKKQIVPATPEQMILVTELAEETCELYDKIQELTAELAPKLAAKKKELLEVMLLHGLKKVEVSGRPPVEAVISNNKNSTKKAIVSVLGVDEGNKLWNNLPIRTSESLSIPPKTPPEA